MFLWGEIVVVIVNLNHSDWVSGKIVACSLDFFFMFFVFVFGGFVRKQRSCYGAGKLVGET